MDDQQLKKTLLGTVEDLVADFLYYDRQEDEGLTPARLADALTRQVVTPAELTAQFADQLELGYKRLGVRCPAQPQAPPQAWSWSEHSAAIPHVPRTMIPALLRLLVEAGYAKDVFQPGGASRFVAEVEKQLTPWGAQDEASN